MINSDSLTPTFFSEGGALKLIRKIDIGLLALILAPIILYLSNQEWLFPYGNPTDTWLNNSFFLNYGKDPLLFLSYKASRLDWIMKGYFFHKYFPDLTAYLIMCFSTYYLATIPFYYIAKSFFKKEVAIIIALAFATYSQFISITSFEWDYTTHDAIANLNIALLFLMFAAKKRHYKIYLFLSGIFCVPSFQNVYPIITFPALAAIFLFLNKKYNQSPIIKSLLYFTLGIITANIFYGAINYFIFNGIFLYFMPELKFAIWFSHSNYRYRSGYWQPILPTLYNTKSILLPATATIVSIFGIILTKIEKKIRGIPAEIPIAFYATCLTFSLMLIAQCLGHSFLSYEHLTIAGVTFFFLSFGAAISLLMGHQKNNVTESTYNAISILSLLSFCAALIFGQYSEKYLVSDYTWILVLVFLICAIYSVKSNLSTSVKFFLLLLLLYVPRLMNSILQPLMTYIYNLNILNVKILIIGLLSAAIVSITIRRYFMQVGFVIFFIIINICTTSIPIELFQFNFNSTYLKDQYIITEEILRLLRAHSLTPSEQPYIWFQNEDSDYHTPIYSNAKIAEIYWGSRSVNLSGIYGAVFGGIYRSGYYGQAHLPRYSLSLNDIKNNCPTLYYMAPKWVSLSGDGNTAVLPMQAAVFTGFMRTNKFSQSEDVGFWLNLMYKNFHLLILTKDKIGYQNAKEAIQKYDYEYVLTEFKEIKTPATTVMAYYGEVRPLANTGNIRQCSDNLSRLN